MNKDKKSKWDYKPQEPVRVKIIRDEITLYNLTATNTKPFAIKLDKHTYVNANTGKITKTINHAITKGDNPISLKKSQDRLVGLIRQNTIDNKKLLLLTLTYADRQKDIKKLGEDFDYFIDKLRKTYTAFGRIEYVYVPELHDNGGYHIHAILFFNQSTRNVFIDLWELSKIWGRGCMSISQPKKYQEVYHYLVPHKANTVTDFNKHMHEKAVKLESMPAGQRLYRASRGLKKPTIYTDNYENVKKFLESERYEFKNEVIYRNPMPTYKGNNLYYCKQTYKKSEKITLEY